MKISLAMATYNGEKYVKTQLDSILNQTRRPDEVVIIDDCSKDNTAKIITKYIEENQLNWSFSVAEKNSGYIGNFANALSSTTGDIVFLCDQDDEWFKDKIEKTLEVFENNPKAMGVATSYILTDADGKPFPKQPNIPNTANNGYLPFEVEKNSTVKIDLKTIVVNCISPGCTTAFKRETVDKYVKETNRTIAHDWELQLLTAEMGEMYYLDIPLMGYRQHGNNTIGVAENDGELKMHSDKKGRIKIFEYQKYHIYVVDRFSYIYPKSYQKCVKAFKKFCNNREQILYHYKLLPAIKNVFLTSRVNRVMPLKFRALLGDILYALKKGNI